MPAIIYKFSWIFQKLDIFQLLGSFTAKINAIKAVKADARWYHSMYFLIDCSNPHGVKLGLTQSSL